MNVFNIIGPVMVGPSSSHTAGAVRIGRIVTSLLGEQPVDATILLYGSFARTYKGHGTDKAIVAGLLGMMPDDERIRNSMELAKASSLVYRFETETKDDEHPNTTLITATGASGKKVIVKGASVGGGNILIKQINDMELEFSGEYFTLVISHKDVQGAIADVAGLLAANEINIANMKVYRSSKGGSAMMVIETDQEIPADLESLIDGLDKIHSATLLYPI